MPPTRQQVYNAAHRRRDVSFVHHDEGEGDDWGEMIDEVRALLTDVDSVLLGGLWYNPNWNDGCVVATAERLAPHFSISVDPALVGSEESTDLRENPVEDLGEVEVVENGIFFASGVPVTFPYLHNTESSPYCGSDFGQDIEPAGFFLLTDTADAAAHPIPGWVYGNITLDSPLVLALQTDESRGVDYYGPSGWKNRLYRAYGLTGVSLSRALLADGYDSIVTVKLQDGIPEYTSEIVDLRAVE